MRPAMTFRKEKCGDTFAVYVPHHLWCYSHSCPQRSLPHRLPVSSSCQKAGAFILLYPFTSFLITISCDNNMTFVLSLMIMIKVFLQQDSTLWPRCRRSFVAYLLIGLLAASILHPSEEIPVSVSFPLPVLSSWHQFLWCLLLMHCSVSKMAWSLPVVNYILGRFCGYSCVKSLNPTLAPPLTSSWVLLCCFNLKRCL